MVHVQEATVKTALFIKVSLLSASSCNYFEMNDSYIAVSSSHPLNKSTPGIHVLAN